MEARFRECYDYLLWPQWRLEWPCFHTPKLACYCASSIELYITWSSRLSIKPNIGIHSTFCGLTRPHHKIKKILFKLVNNHTKTASTHLCWDTIWERSSWNLKIWYSTYIAIPQSSASHTPRVGNIGCVATDETHANNVRSTSKTNAESQGVQVVQQNYGCWVSSKCSTALKFIDQNVQRPQKIHWFKIDRIYKITLAHMILTHFHYVF